MLLSDSYFSEIYPHMSGEDAFMYYEHVRPRLPTARFPEKFGNASDLLQIADHFDVFVFDAYGVLNIGTTPIAGGSQCIKALRNLNKRVFVVTNGASFDAHSNVKKFAGLGYEFGLGEVMSSRMAAEQALQRYGSAITWGAVAKEDFSPSEFAQPVIKLKDDAVAYDQVTGFLFLSTLDWNSERQRMLEGSLEKNPRPVIIANPDIVSPRETHFGIEPGYLGHRLAERYNADVVFYGKPFPSVFELVEGAISPDIDRQRICMIGDTLHTDILGGAARGWKTILVSGHGMFKGLDAGHYIQRSGLVPDWVIPTI